MYTIETSTFAFDLLNRLASTGSDEKVEYFVRTASMLTTTVFTMEVVCKIVAEGFEPLHYFTDPDLGRFNTFDFIIVFVGYLFMAMGSDNGSALGALRMLRLIRLFTFVKGVPQLRAIIGGLLKVRRLRSAL